MDVRIDSPHHDVKNDLELDERKEDNTEEQREEFLAHLSAQNDHDQTVSEALLASPWTIVWLCYGIWIIVCCSFDGNAGSIVVGIPKFREDFGYRYQGNWILPADWQSAFSGGPAATTILGTFVSGSKSFDYPFE